MSNLKLCQGTKCHTYHTQDRLKGTKGNKTYQTRRRSSFYYGNENFCSLNCQTDWFNDFGDRAINHFGRLREAKRVECDNAWYKDYTYNYDRINNRNNNTHYFVNDLLGQKIPITEQEYDNHDLTTPNSIS